MEKVCRLCGESSNTSMYNIFNKNDCGQQLIQLIKQCLPILIYRTDPLSKEICESCYSKLNEYSSFQKKTITVHDKFKVNLSARTHESPVKLYIDTLEDAYQPESIKITNCRSLRPVRNHACQIQVETRSIFTNTSEQLNNQKIIAPVQSIKILTPSLINEKSTDNNVFISLQSEDGTVQKKRRLAGPKSKTRIQPIRRYFPASLLQCALKQINKNFNLTEDFSVSDNTSETAMETETSEYSLSRSESQERDDYVYTPELNINMIFNTDFYNENLNINEPVDCNYCMQSFENMPNLASHEIKHIKVDIGPKCDSKEFGYKCKKLVGYYHNYVARQNMTDDIPAPPPKPLPKPREVRIRPIKPPMRPPVRPMVKPLVKPELKPKQLERIIQGVKINPWHERTQHVVDDENSLLVPQETPVHVFKIENYQILINGKPFKEMTKEERRVCYKDMMINGIKRKYCSLCRHTFKDNWSIETHYLSDVCMYTCKYCGRKFKYQKELFEDHLTLHKGEPINKIFGPTDRKLRFKKRMKKTNRTVFVANMNNIPPKVKPIKMKQLMQKKNMVPPIKIKSEPDFPPDVPSSSNRRTEPYQAYFCRKCFKVFFNVNEYNKHIRVCNGANRKNSRNSDSKSATSAASATSVNSANSATSETCTTPESSSSRRPVRSCVKEIKARSNDSDVDSDDITPKRAAKKIETVETGFECGICCSSFPSKHSRNSHMRIHKGQTNPHKTGFKSVLNKVAPKSHTITKHDQPQISNNIPSNLNSDLRLSNLNPAVARLVQNNPHLTIRSFSKAQVEKHQQEKMKVNMDLHPQRRVEQPPQMNDSPPEHKIKRVYKCADCEDTFENKSVLYYHKMNSCIVKRHYECAFCRKKFGTYDQYNTHMFYVHPE